MTTRLEVAKDKILRRADYEILARCEIAELQSEVIERLANGWLLVGGIEVVVIDDQTGNGDRQWWYFQSMWRPAEVIA